MRLRKRYGAVVGVDGLIGLARLHVDRRERREQTFAIEDPLGDRQQRVVNRQLRKQRCTAPRKVLWTDSAAWWRGT